MFFQDFQAFVPGTSGWPQVVEPLRPVLEQLMRGASPTPGTSESRMIAILTSDDRRFAKAFLEKQGVLDLI